MSVLQPRGLTLSLEREREPSSSHGILPTSLSGFDGKGCFDVESSEKTSKLFRAEHTEICQFSMLSDFPLVGSGVAHEACGSFFTVGCLNSDAHESGQAYIEVAHNSCHRPICPTCWRDWASRETFRAKKRLDAFVLKGRNLKPIHLIVSVPSSDYNLSLLELRLKVYKGLKKVHCLGGMMIYHSKRHTDAGLWYFSPHFHILGYGWILDIRQNYVESGYVVKNVGIRKAVEGTIWYQLSHAGISPKHHSVTWFGALSYGKLKVSKEEKEKRVCPLCGEPLNRVFWIGSGDCPLPDVEGMAFYDDVCNWETLSTRQAICELDHLYRRGDWNLKI